jgi:hypothetical protein
VVQYYLGVPTRFESKTQRYKTGDTKSTMNRGRGPNLLNALDLEIQGEQVEVDGF